MQSPPFDFDYLRSLVREHSAVVLEPYKDYLAALYLGKLAAQNGFESIAPFIDHLKNIPFGDLHLQTVEALMINETSFFRDRYPFTSLQSLVLPTLIQARSQQKTINIWCAACSTGQEPYSIAILIRQHFPELADWKIRLTASDFSKQALDRAKQGQYTNLEVNRGLPPTLRDRYFYPVGRAWQLRDEIRKMVEFQQLNLIQSWASLPKLDILFLRNVLIYFDIETKRSILDKVQQYLQPDGYLFLGGGETIFHVDSRFETIQNKTSLYHRIRGA
ncbi:MAG TPA: protein-glutamate O-methyltransferase CheR [Leptolyngbya sp.]|jgi:chemotaxis protein methyltransferase CheR|nr:protein-glutamate O-methyltransferase CheR [Leptolyngbya sp.]